ncbi:MAG: hypothetical protein ACD_39C01102G0001 [uncultured bacterium]|nr:MAG: hypothetical protein ACD_39C01102G0001 [uncultured bacterium]
MLASPEKYISVKAILMNEADPDGQNRLANSMLSTKIDYDKQLRSIMQKLTRLSQGFVEQC